MPPSAIARSVAQRHRRARRARSRNSSAEAGGNFGAPPKPPWSASKLARRRRHARRRAAPASSSALRTAPAARCAAQALRAAARRLRAISSRCSSTRRRSRCSTCANDGHPVARLGREVRAAVERDPLGREEHGQRPAAVAGHRLHGLHVDRVDVGTLLAIDLHADEVLVHQRGDRRVLEGLALHHVAPVAGRVADRDSIGLSRSRARAQRLVAPRVPVHRIVARAGAGTGWSRREGVGHGAEATAAPLRQPARAPA